MVEPLRPSPLHLVIPPAGATRSVFEDAVIQAMRELSAAFNRLDDTYYRMAEEVLRLGGDVRRHDGILAPYLAPPIPHDRRESPSSADLARHVSRDVIETVKAYEANPSTPPGPPDERALQKIIEERVAAGLAMREAQRLQKSIDERADKDRKDADADRKIRVQKWLTLLAVIAGLSAWLAQRFLGH